MLQGICRGVLFIAISILSVTNVFLYILPSFPLIGVPSTRTV